MEKRSKGPPAYETPAMVTYQARDLLEEIAITYSGCSGCSKNTSGRSSNLRTILPVED